MPVEVKFRDPELRERYSGSKRPIVRKTEKFFLREGTTLEIDVKKKRATIILDSGFTLSVTAPEGGNKTHALQMQEVLEKGSSAQVMFGKQIIADLKYT